MTVEIETTFHEELRSFFALAFLNIVFAALTLAFGISIVVTQVLALLDAGTVQIGPVAYLLLGGVAAAVGLWWLPKSAEVFGDVEDLQEAEARADHDAEEIVRLMVGMLAMYRHRKEMVGGMVLVSRIGGAIFLLASAANLIGLVVQLTGPTGAEAPPPVAIGIAGIAVTTGMGVAALLISVLFRRYSAAWDTRLAESDRVGAILTQVLGREGLCGGDGHATRSTGRSSSSAVHRGPSPVSSIGVISTRGSRRSTSGSSRARDTSRSSGKRRGRST